VYCESIVHDGKLKRHIKRKHKSKQEVQDILKEPKSIQDIFFDKKRREGIYEFNVNLLAEGKEAKMRERKPKYEDQLRVCLDCNGYYSNRYFFKHKCVTEKPEALKPNLLKKTSQETIDNDSDFTNILNRFRDGEVGDTCRTDKFIKVIGYRHFNLRRHETGKQDEVRKVVMAEMRELAKLLQTFKSLCNTEKTVEDMFSRPHLPDLIQSIQLLTTDEDTKVEKHGQKLFIDAVILRSLKTLKGYYSETLQDEKRAELKNFKAAYKHKSSEIYPKARQTCVINSLEKSRKPSNLPDEAALRELKCFMTPEINYIQNNYDIKDYVWLRSLVVAKLTLYNARRGEEAARMLQSEWEDACKDIWVPEDQVEKVTDPAEQFLLGQFKLAYLKGKGRKYVPVLVPVDLITPISILNRDRKAFGIKEDNVYLFATRNGDSHCSGWHAVSEVCQRSNIKLPVNATGMRHRLSSIFASLDMSSKDQKIFLDHMGHDMNINKENYQCPPGVRAVCVMGKVLMDADKGNTLHVHIKGCPFFREY
jgi:chorismate mutase